MQELYFTLHASANNCTWVLTFCATLGPLVSLVEFFQDDPRRVTVRGATPNSFFEFEIPGPIAR